MRRAAVLGSPGRQGAEGSAVRFRDDRPEERERAREAVRQWRAANPQGTPGQMAAELGPHFPPDYGPVLRAVLFRTDLRDAKVTTGITVAGEDQATGTAGASR